MGEAKRRKKLDPTFGKAPLNKKLPDFGHWWHSQDWEEGELLVLTIASDSSVLLATQTSPQSLGFCVHCSDGQLRKGHAEFPNLEMASKFLETISFVHSPPQEGGVNVMMTLEPNKAYITSEEEQVCPMSIQNFAYDTDIENPNNAIKLLESLNLKNKRVLCAAAD